MKSVVRLSALGMSIDGADANHVTKQQLGAAIKAKLGLK